MAPGYPVVWFAMGAILVVIVVYFKRKGWL